MDIGADPRESENVDATPADRQLDASAPGGLAPPETPRPLLPAWASVLVAVIAAFILQAVGAVGAALLISGPDSIMKGRLEPDFVRNPVIMLASAVLPTAFLLVWWVVVDRRTLPQMGLRLRPSTALRDLVGGAAGGIGLMAVVVAAGLLAGGWRIALRDGDDAGAWLGITFPLFVAAAFEEVVMRGVMLQHVGRRWPLLGLAVSSGLFSALHLANPNTGEGGQGLYAIQVLGILAAGLMLGTLFLRTGSLWLAIGVHFGWNWAQGVLFGLPVSGIVLPSIAEGTIVRSSLVTGGAFGPESSLIALVIIGLLAIEGTVAVVRRPPALPATGPRHPDEAFAPPAPAAP